MEMINNSSNALHRDSSCYADHCGVCNVRLQCMHRFHNESMRDQCVIDGCWMCPVCALQWPSSNNTDAEASPSPTSSMHLDDSPKRASSAPASMSSPTAVQYKACLKACLECRKKKKGCTHTEKSFTKRCAPGNTCIECKRLKRRCEGIPCDRCREGGKDCQPQAKIVNTKKIRERTYHWKPMTIFSPGVARQLVQGQQTVSVNTTSPVSSPILDATMDHGPFPSTAAIESSEGNTYVPLFDYSFSYPQNAELPQRPHAAKPVSAPARIEQTLQDWIRFSINLILGKISSKAISILCELGVLNCNLAAELTRENYFSAFDQLEDGCSWLKNALDVCGNMKVVNTVCRLGMILNQYFSRLANIEEKFTAFFSFLMQLQDAFSITCCENCSNGWKDYDVPEISEEFFQSFMIWHILIWYNFVCLNENACLEHGHSADVSGLSSKVQRIVDALYTNLLNT
ncbi:hypothetical protein BC938DRAFT_473931 [Jimgerdemannia flammicorona]|uniref:Zn(2)-C6 fungal-type domain-containing protein n=1 Tax=Jimgerdemannia flammicorona TaxID=994334 RepID=A0A433QT19_9FUNG|nr:hypothetical protein BC938DRAFT_473931 [Jimgerdemannia flammicorona]